MIKKLNVQLGDLVPQCGQDMILAKKLDETIDEINKLNKLFNAHLTHPNIVTHKCENCGWMCEVKLRG